MQPQPASRTSKPPLGGIRGDWRRRFFQFHLPLAVASVLVLVLFVTLAIFDATAYSVMDTRSESLFPQEIDQEEMEEMHRGENGSMDREEMQEMHRGGEDAERMEDEDMDHGENDAERTGGDAE